MTHEELLRLALMALENGKKVREGEAGTEYQPPMEDAAIIALRQALVTEQGAEPLAMLSIEVCGSNTTVDIEWGSELSKLVAGSYKLYTDLQPARKPLGKSVLLDIDNAHNWQTTAGRHAAYRDIERAHNIKE